MRTIDHWKYAKRMTKDLAISRVKKLAFQIGCVMPDFNKFSYMGHHINDWALGHSFRVRRREIVSFFEHAFRDSVFWWYKAGLRIHYLGDSFSRPHNPEFGYDSKSHVAYEWDLHDRMQPVLRKSPFAHAKVTGSLGRWLSRRHEKYMKTTTGIEDDARYIDSTLMGFWDYVREHVLPSGKK